jgi:putative oxidoreductase
MLPDREKEIKMLLEPLLPYVGYLSLIVRVWMGGNMMAHGRQKLGKAMAQPIQYFKTMGVPEVATKMGIYLEFFGGALLVIGLLVPIVGVLFAVYMSSIVIVKKTKQHAQYIAPGKPSYELDVLYLMLAIVLVFLGAGVLSLDSLIGF